MSSARPQVQLAPMHALADILAELARTQPDAELLRSAQGTRSCAEVAAQAASDAASLRAQGFAAGDIAAIAAGSDELLRATLACALAGIALAPLDPASATTRLPALLALGGKRLRQASLPAGEGDFSADGVADASARAAALREHGASAEHEKPALVIATSGSEGTPKAVMLSAASLAAAAHAAKQRLPLGQGDVWLACLPLHHIGGISIIHRCLHAGAAISLHQRFDALAVWREIASGDVSHVSLTPAMLSRLLDVADAAPPARLRHALVGGAALSRALFARARAAGWPLRPSWGMSESAAQAATRVENIDDWHKGEAGTLLDGLECRVEADGRLALRGPQIMLGYLNPELTPGLGLHDGWFVTSDLGRIETGANGANIVVLGRADDMLVSGGVNVHPLEVEARLAACPGVDDVAVTALPDPVWGDLLVALFVGAAESGFVHDFSRQHLASAQRPRRVLRVSRLPRNAMDKIDRKALRAMAGEAA
ncbi:class I adenylate-forming enzyme family protein [Rhodocyclus tenuis]|uniref:class I adenylate-forming enzyme family protein n=1 Tax=Rhodocyclus tenuis TaxID=1066 RepID=UPI0019089363|nr:AMP-binding protein [Rhodocyclus tenuis]